MVDYSVICNSLADTHYIVKNDKCIYQFEVIERAEEGDEPADDPHDEAGPHRPGVGEDAARRDEDARAFVDRLMRTIFLSFIFTYVLVPCSLL